MTAYFPLFINLEQKKFCIFGAGQVAARRIPGLVRHGAFVTVIADRIGEEIQILCEQHPNQIQVQTRSYQMGEIRNEWADYVLAATDDEKVNLEICRECRHKEIPVNNASDRTQCDFYFPALVERDQLVIGITSTDGSHKKVAKVSEALRNSDFLYGKKEEQENCSIRIVHVKPY